MLKILILAGGVGSRLGNITKNTPKPMLKINNKVFITFVIDKLLKERMHDITISTGYKSRVIENFFKNSLEYPSIKILPEKKKLGTGGAVNFFLSKNKNIKELLVINGDTFFDFNLKRAFNKFKKFKNSLIVCRKIKNNNRYGSIQIDNNGNITNFSEKRKNSKKYILINSGFYFFKKNDIENIKSPSSLELYLEKNIKKKKFKSYVSKGKFIDIGIKKDLLLSKKILFV